jgi:DNA-binding CsgD family transcriptional regulator
MLVEHMEWAGRRYLVVVERDPSAPSLTERESQVVEHAASGATNKEIAYDLHITHATVRVLLHRAARKLGVRGRAELIEAFKRQSAVGA